MGLIRQSFTFPTEAPTKEVLQQRLAAVTGIQVSITCFPDEAAPALAYEDWEISFESQDDRFSEKLWCRRESKKLTPEAPIDALNHCPNYLLHVTTVVIEDLGGRCERRNSEQSTDIPMPPYARASFADWKLMNRGVRPPKWKSGLLFLGWWFYVCIVA